MELEILARYKAWADDRLYGCVSELPEDELTKDRAMLFGNILSLLHHVYSMDTVWKAHLNGVRHDLLTRNPEVGVSFEELRKKQNAINFWYQSYFSDLSKDNYTERVGFDFIGGGPGNMERAEILRHVVNHSTYHRGHVEGVLYQLFIKPPNTDMPVFLKS